MAGSDAAISGGILRAADRVFRQSGYERAEMRTIARQAGIAVGTIYNYFPSKWGLFLRVLYDRWDHVEQRVRELRADTALDWHAQLLGILETLMGYVAENAAIWTEIEAMAAAGHRRSGGGDPAVMRQVLDWLTGQVAETLADSGQPRYRSAAARQRAALVLVAATSSLARRLPREPRENLDFLGALIPA